MARSKWRGYPSRPVRKAAFHFECRESLAELLARADGHELPLCAADGLVDGDWLVVAFTLGELTTCVPGRVVLHGTPEDPSFGVELAEHDFERLRSLVDDEPPDSAPPPSRQSPPEAVTPPPGTEVMVVHDDADVCSLLARMLSRSGFSVTEVATAREAIGRLARSTPHIVLADWTPEDPATRELRAAVGAREPRPSLVFLACPSRRGDRERALSAGADDFVVLPFRYRELGVRLLSLVER